MKILFLVSMNPNKKAGLFNATHSRIKNLVENFPIEYEIYNVTYENSFLLKIVLKILKIDFNETQDFVYEKILYKRLSFKRGIMSKIFEKNNIESNFNVNKISSILNEKKFDLISSHWGNIGILAKNVNKLIGVPYTITFHGSDINYNLALKSRKKIELLESMRMSSKNIFVSKALLDSAKKNGYSGENAQVIYNGVDFVKLDALRKKNNEENPKIKKIGFIGNLVDVKNAEILIDIFEEIVVQFKNSKIEFLIIGDGILKDKILKKNQKSFINCKILGRLSNEETLNQMKEFSLLVLPSKNEGMPMVLLEAQALGIKSIGSRIGGISEVIGIENTVELNDEFIKNFSKLAVEKLNEKNKIKFDEKFDSKKIALEEYVLFKKILKKND